MVINNWITINNTTIKAGTTLLPPLPANAPLTAETLYTALQCSYPKFFKMDSLCKWAFVATECLFYKNDLYTGIPKNKIGVALTTGHGCLDVDKRYLAGISIPSPALFVYTLPNIMLGEICIRHGFKGEQNCMITEQYDPNELFFTTTSILNSGMDATLCGWADVNGDQHDLCLFWISKKGPGIAFTVEALRAVYHSRKS
jgi:hypothetical protein